MDDTQASSRSTTDAGATRKRRSSILKSQRPPRTPLSELELHVATPTDTAKSRRVSFSRRTGVAEFVTNEATTTWKNFYEEQNKSLENSGNDSVLNVPRQMSIGHIGKRIFDQQFEEVEIVDIGGTLRPKSLAQDFHTSLNNLNITQQLASLECPSDDRKLTVPHQNFDLSSFTDHQSKVFRDDLTVPTMPEMTNPININFSMQPLSSKNKCDDLDEIVKDLERSQQANVVGPSLFKGDNMSEYIEVDLNMTHAGIKNNEYEMSITDTIQSPKVQEVSKSLSSIHTERKLNDENDWIVDKENIAINPYVTPKESKNFAINDSSEKILVFDGKKLTVTSERDTLPSLDKKDNFRSTLLPDHLTNATPKRKTIVLNTNDDLPNFMSNSLSDIEKQVDSSNNVPQLKQSVIYNDCDLSITQAASNKLDVPKRKTILFEDDMGNISITQAVPAKVIVNKQEKRKTIIYENNSANISVTQAVPTNIIGASKIVEKRKTVVYENDISFTQTLPKNLILNDIIKESQDKTMYYQDVVDMSVTQVIPDNILNVLKNNSNISINQAIPSNINTADVKQTESAKTLIFDANEDIDIEITQAVSDNVLLSVKNSSEKRKTIMFEEDAGDISVTQMVPANILLEKLEIKCDPKTEIRENEENITLNKYSVHSVPVNAEINVGNQNNDIENTSNRRKTIIYNDEAGDISMTQIMPSNIIMLKEPEKMETSSDHDLADISITRALPTNILLQKSENSIKKSNLTLPTLNINTQNMSTNLNTSENKEFLAQLIEENKTKRHSEIHESSGCNLSMTKPIPSILIQEDIVKETEVCAEKSLHLPQTEDLLKNNLSIKQDILIYQVAEKSYSQSEIESVVKISPPGRESIIIESKESLVSKQNPITNDSDITVYKKSSINKVNESYNEDKQVIETECVSKKTSDISQIITDTREKNLKAKKSFLNELLDMSNASLKTVDKCDVSVAESCIAVDKSTNEDIRSNNDGKSNESVFVVISDDEDFVKKENFKDNNISGQLQKSFTNEPIQKDSKHTPTVEYMEESEDKQELHSKIAELKADNLPKRTSNRHYEKVISSDIRDDGESFVKSEIQDKSMRISKKSFKYADNTRELLGMLSDFTEGENDEVQNDFTEADNDEVQNDKPKTTIETKENLAIKIEHEPKGLSIIPKRQSIALSREDLLNNISMAQAALQQSRFEIYEDESIEETCDSPEETIEPEKLQRKSARISNEVVKKLQYEGDDSVSEANLETSVRKTPLKKTAFGETTYMGESKAKVIPSYLKDVSDNLKSLMSDLVKPMADVMPYETGDLDKSLKPSVSTCSTQIQANLVTSSQIDFDVELHSNSDSVENIKNVKTARSPNYNKTLIEKPASHNKEDHSLARAVHSASISMEIDHYPHLQTNIKHPIPQSPVKGATIVFDHSNPLNNVLLPPIDGDKVHKYNPLNSTETMRSEHENFTQMDDTINENNIEVERLSVHYNVDSIVCQQQTALQSGDNCIEKLKDTCSLASNVSKPLSIDRSTEGLALEVKSTEVNTLIAMKGNKELLEASSSLTLVDDALARSVFDIKLASKISKENDQKSPLRVVYHMETDNIDSDVTSVTSKVEDEEDSSTTRKRSYSPTRTNDHSKSNVEVTPKPVSKMQKMSNGNLESKKTNEHTLRKVKTEPISNMGESPSNIRKTKEKSPKKKSSKRDNTEYSRDTISDKETPESIVSSQNLGEGVKSMEIVDSFTSSKRAREMQDVDSAASVNRSSNASSVNCIDGRTDFDGVTSLSECSSSVNVVDRINMLKFMGSCDCEWESSGGDVWTFLLLHARVRLAARLSHRHYNASRSRVLADTPLEAVTVDPVRQVEKDPLAALCVRFAAEAMRYECARVGGVGGVDGVGGVAGDVPALLRRCAHVARVAVRWARCMRDARLRLAYNLTADGDLAFKVANIALRSVWEVRMRLELVAEAAGGAWPRATHVRAPHVLADGAPAGHVAELAARAPHDWRHAPHTIWSVFRYLKNKSRDERRFLDVLSPVQLD